MPVKDRLAIEVYMPQPLDAALHEPKVLQAYASNVSNAGLQNPNAARDASEQLHSIWRQGDTDTSHLKYAVPSVPSHVKQAETV